ncbi:MAG: CrcB protein [bacterium]|nr:MAG: CrcB protein [bacterium]
MTAFLAIGLGAALGAWLRWGLGLWLNALSPALPYGTLAANLLGGYLVGLAIAYFAGLTTFSTFSAEVFTLLSRGQLAWALAAASAHLFGSLVLTALGVWSYALVKG